MNGIIVYVVIDNVGDLKPTQTEMLKSRPACQSPIKNDDH